MKESMAVAKTTTELLSKGCSGAQELDTGSPQQKNGNQGVKFKIETGKYELGNYYVVKTV